VSQKTYGRVLVALYPVFSLSFGCTVTIPYVSAFPLRVPPVPD
jgi:hypothetical protein